MKSARETALKILYEIFNQGAYSNIELKKVLSQETLSGADKALVTELVMGVVKNLKFLDYQIASLSKIKMKKISPWILNVIRLGIYQIQFTRIPMRAAVDESVKLAGRYGHQGSKGFVNAILRKAETPILPDESDLTFFLAVQHSYPEWMVSRWLKEFGEEKTREILKAGNEVPPTTVRLNATRSGVNTDELEKSDWTDVTFYANGAAGTTKAFLEGEYTIQDGASHLVAFALGAKPGERVLDVCAAPGGKTTHIAELMGNSGEVIACDIYDHKLALIENARDRLRLPIIKTVRNDATKYREELGLFDRVLVDAPCSGLGIIRRKPDIKWNRSEEEIGELVKIQREILTQSAKYLLPGGTLLYSTCTITPEENHDNVMWFLSEHPEFSLAPFGEDFPVKAFREKCEVQLLPGEFRTDGFYLCRLVRNK